MKPRSVQPRLALLAFAALAAFAGAAFADPGEGPRRGGGGPQPGMDGDWRGRDGGPGSSGGRRFVPSETPPSPSAPPGELSGGPPPGEARMRGRDGRGGPPGNQSGPERHHWEDRGGQRWTEDGSVSRDWGRPEQAGGTRSHDPRRQGGRPTPGDRPPGDWRHNDSGRNDWGRNDWGRNDWSRDDRGQNNWGPNDWGRNDWSHDDRGWREDNRYRGAPGYAYDRRYVLRDRDRGRHWYSPGLYRDYYRVSYRFRAPPYRYPAGWYARDWRCGEFLPWGWYDPYYYLDWRAYGLAFPAIGCEWVRVGSSAVLIDIHSGRILSIAYDVFY